jgi:hypothetical protein
VAALAQLRSSLLLTDRFFQESMVEAGIHPKHFALV